MANGDKKYILQIGRGIDGKSAYQLARDAGYVGTLDQWLESLKGEPGAKGEPGEPGAKGEPGEKGEVNYATFSISPIGHLLMHCPDDNMSITFMIKDKHLILKRT